MSVSSTAYAQTAPVLQLTNIGKDFGAIRALSGIDLSIAPGEVVGLMGDNGAGKSTLVKIMAGNFHPTHGTIRFDGRRSSLRPAARCAKRPASRSSTRTLHCPIT